MPHRLAPQVLHRLEFVFGVLHRPPPQQAPQVLCRRGRFAPSSPSTSAGTAGALPCGRFVPPSSSTSVGTAGALPCGRLVPSPPSTSADTAIALPRGRRVSCVSCTPSAAPGASLSVVARATVGMNLGPSGPRMTGITVITNCGGGRAACRPPSIFSDCDR